MHFLKDIEDHQNIEISSLDVEKVNDEFRVKFTENFRVNFNVKGKKLDRITDILFKLAVNKSFDSLSYNINFFFSPEQAVPPLKSFLHRNFY